MANRNNIRRKAAERNNAHSRVIWSSVLSPNIKIMALMSIALVFLMAVALISVNALSHKKTAAAHLASAENGAQNAAARDDNIQSDTLALPDFNETERPALSAQSAESADDEEKADDTASSDAAVIVTKTELDPALAPLPFDGVLEYGSDHESIANIQARLMELNYMDNDEPTTHYGPITRDSISMFQRRNNLEITGKVDEDTYRLLMSDTALTYMISLGDDGDDITGIQERLYEMSYMSIKPTGHYGDVTEAAVKLFQEKNNILVDGKVGVETKNLLYSESAVPNVWSLGDKSDAIIPYQERLIKLGYFASTSSADGKYDSETIQAVKRFQDRNGLISDGYLGPKTVEVLMSSDAIGNSLTIGLRGDDVEKVQQRLYKLGYVKKSSVTGYYGTATDYAVRAFQKRNGLTVDGRVGKVTMSVLMSESAKEPGSGYKFYSESGSSSGSGSSSSGNSGNSGSGNGGSSSNNSGSPTVANLVAIAKSRLGCRYVTGGKGPSKFDCSGLVYWCLNQAGIKQSYLTSYSWRSVTKYQRITNINNLRAGDVIVFYGHVGLIVSNSEMIDASSSRGKVVCRSFKTNWCRSEFICGYRIFD